MKWIFLFLLLSSKAFAGAEFYISMPFGFSKMNETRLVGTAEHSSISDFGISAGARYHFEFNWIDFGVVGEWAWQGHTMDYYSTATSGTYRIERNRYLLGPSLHLPLMKTGLAIEAEYYPLYNATITYSDDKSINPFRKNDKQSGSGWSAGLSFQIGFLKIAALYRVLEITKSDFSGAAAGSTFSNFKTNETIGTVGVAF